MFDAHIIFRCDSQLKSDLKTVAKFHRRDPGEYARIYLENHLAAEIRRIKALKPEGGDESPGRITPFPPSSLNERH